MLYCRLKGGRLMAMNKSNINVREANAFFAAANSGDGFLSFFDEIFFGDGIGRRYIVKGGPGTGKSSFMRRIARYAEEKEKSVEYYYCSSDTESLDGIIVDGNIAIFDGTSPHSYDAVLPGACDEFLNLGEFWDAEKLRASAEPITVLSRSKKEAYSRAYGYLGAAKALSRTLDGLLPLYTDRAKLERAVQRLCKGIRGEGRGMTLVKQVSAFGTKGRAELTSLRNRADKIFYVDEYYGTAGIFFRTLIAVAEANGCMTYVSFDTVDTSKPREVYFPQTGECFTSLAVGGDGERHVNMKRFTDATALAEVRGEYRAGRQAYESLCELALRELSRAGELHARLEKYYVDSMDFDALRGFTSAFAEKLFT